VFDAYLLSMIFGAAVQEAKELQKIKIVLPITCMLFSGTFYAISIIRD